MKIEKTIYDEEARTMAMYVCIALSFVALFSAGLLLNVSVKFAALAVVLTMLFVFFAGVIAIVKAIRKDVS